MPFNNNLPLGDEDIVALNDGGAIPVNTDKRIAIVFSETTQANFYNSTSYAQLVLSAQAQAMQAGIPFDLISESQLTNSTFLSQYGAIVFPSFSHVPSTLVAPISAALAEASNTHGVGLIAAGDFMTNDETGAAMPGNSYATMQSLLGVTAGGFGATNGLVIQAVDTTHPILDGYAAHEVVDSYGNLSFGYYNDVTGSGTGLFTQRVDDGTKTYAVIATETGGRNVHFSSDAVLGNSNILWEAIDWAVNGDEPAGGVRLSMTRGSGLLASRNDMDYSRMIDDVAVVKPGIYDKMVPIMEDLYREYGFVSSYYINIGANPPEETTDWAVSAPYYQALLALESEIGTHSRTHPYFTDQLTPAQIQYEFQQSAQEIAARLGIQVVGAAIPGAPETYLTATEVLKYFDYISGGYSSQGAGYPNAVGFLTPDTGDSVYIAPNMSFDFSLIGFRGLNATQAAAVWSTEYQDIGSHAATPVYVFPWHDYGMAEWEAGYTTQMFEDVISRAHADGVEFVTLADLADRVQAMQSTRLNVVDTAAGYDVTVRGADIGTFSLTLDGGQKIRKVENWYAYNEDTVFLPTGGGTFRIETGSTPDDVTHVVSLPMRADLRSLSGDGTNLYYGFIGAGDMGVSLVDWGRNSVIATGTDGASLNGNLLTLNFETAGPQTGAVVYRSDSRLVATAGDDAIVAGSGRKTVVAGTGDDVIFSGAGSDTFVFAAQHGHDVIHDDGRGWFDFDTLDLSTVRARDVTLQRVDNDLLVTLDNTQDTVLVVDQFEGRGFTPNEGLERIKFWDAIYHRSDMYFAAMLEA